MGGPGREPDLGQPEAQLGICQHPQAPLLGLWLFGSPPEPQLPHCPAPLPGVVPGPGTCIALENEPLERCRGGRACLGGSAVALL